MQDFSQCRISTMNDDKIRLSAAIQRAHKNIKTPFEGFVLSTKALGTPRSHPSGEKSGEWWRGSGY